MAMTTPLPPRLPVFPNERDGRRARTHGDAPKLCRKLTELSQKNAPFGFMILSPRG